MSQFPVAGGSATRPHLNWSIWRQWVVVNAIAELVGLGTAALIAMLIFTGLEAALNPLAMALIMILAGTLLEGVIVGTGQWLVLRRAISRLPRRSWVSATAAGAFAAWTLGMIPSTIMSMAELEGGATPPTEINDWVVYSLAALMGLALGLILGLPQWWILGRYVRRAAWWIPANALAWMAGMVLLFVGMGTIPQSMSAVALLILLTSVLLAGAVAGAIHGLILIWLLKQKE